MTQRRPAGWPTHLPTGAATNSTTRIANKDLTDLRQHLTLVRLLATERTGTPHFNWTKVQT